MSGADWIIGLMLGGLMGYALAHLEMYSDKREAERKAKRERLENTIDRMDLFLTKQKV